jgi:hypothetical protein
MRTHKAIAALSALMLALFPLACGEPFSEEELAGEWVKGEHGKEDASSVAVFLDFEFDGELLASYAYNPKGVIEDQLLYTVGQLNGDRSVSRIDRL